MTDSGQLRRHQTCGDHGAAPAGLWKLALAVVLSPGCYHIVMPVSPSPLPSEMAPLGIEVPHIVRLVNGYTESRIVWFRTEGIHHIGVDLREWTDRLISQLQVELESRGVNTVIGRSGEPPDPKAAVLRIRITRIRPPSSASDAIASNDPQAGGGPILEATIESDDGTYRAEYSSGVTSNGFSDALYHLKESILVEDSLRQWLRLRASSTD